MKISSDIKARSMLRRDERSLPQDASMHLLRRKKQDPFKYGAARQPHAQETDINTVNSLRVTSLAPEGDLEVQDREPGSLKS